MAVIWSLVKEDYSFALTRIDTVYNSLVDTRVGGIPCLTPPSRAKGPRTLIYHHWRRRPAWSEGAWGLPPPERTEGTFSSSNLHFQSCQCGKKNKISDLWKYILIKILSCSGTSLPFCAFLTLNSVKTQPYCTWSLSIIHLLKNSRMLYHWGVG